MTRSRDRAAYLRRLGAEPSAATLKAALDRAHELRRFEIENYWRRSTYFWGFQLAALAALAIARQSGALSGPALMAVAILGMVTAYTGVLTARGSKFWQRNWEAHVDYLEDENEGRLHKTVLVPDRTLAPSVSHANERLLVLLSWGWAIAFVAGAAITLRVDPAAALGRGGIVAVMTLLAIAALTLMRLTPESDLADRAYDRETVRRLPRPTARTDLGRCYARWRRAGGRHRRHPPPASPPAGPPRRN